MSKPPTPAFVNSESFFESVIEQAPNPFAILRGPELRFHFANRKYRDSVGNRPLLGLSVREAFPELKGQGFYELLDQVYASGVAFEAKEAHVILDIRNDGNPVDTFQDFTFQPFYNADGKLDGVSVSAVDVTERALVRNAVRAEQKRLNDIFELSPVAICILEGPDHLYTLANERYQQIVFRDRPLVGRTVREALPELKGQGIYELLDQVYSTGVPYEGLEVPVSFIDKSGESRIIFVNFIYHPIVDSKGKARGIMVVANDVTTQVHARVAIEEAKDQAEMANELKTSFLANMSHEIRTPLGAIIGFTDIMKSGKATTAETEHYLDVILRNGKSLIRIIDDILDLSKVEAGRLEVELGPFSFPSLMLQVAELFEDAAKRKQISIDFHVEENVPDWMISDQTRLRQILINIVGNAVKFTNAGGVQVDVRVNKQNQNAGIETDIGTKLHIEVSDSGPGMTNAQADRLFIPFHQADNSTTRRFGGTGLGLALSRRLAKVLGGDVTLKAHAPGKGCVFEIELGVRAVDPVTLVPENKWVEVHDLKRMDIGIKGSKILVVDDSADNLELFTMVLEDLGAVTTQAVNGQEAVDKALAGDFDLILMDIQMPVLDGYEAVKSLRAQGFTKPIIALTAHAMNEERERVMRSGFQGHVTKPIDVDVLANAIQKVLL